MTHLYVIPKRYTQKYNTKLKLTRVTLFIAILVIMTMILSACVADDSVHLTIENRLPTDVTFTLQVVTPNGNAAAWNLGTIPAGQTKKTQSGFISGGLGLEPKVILQGNDPSGNVVWQHTWTGEEFVKLKDMGWKIVVSPETSD